MPFDPEKWPTFTDAQVSFLENLFPSRPIDRTETIEDHLRFAGKVELIAAMRTRVTDGDGPRMETAFELTEDEAAEFDEDEAVRIALENQRSNT
jgi:hypothetical protein